MYYPEADQLIFFPGGGASSIWKYSFASPGWTQVSTSGAGGSVGALGAYDTLRKRFVFYGGLWTHDDTGNNSFLAFNPQNNTWADLTLQGIQPPARSYAGMVYNSRHDVYILHSDQDSDNAGTWVYDPDNPGWTQIAPGTGPGRNHKNPFVVYDSKNDVLIAMHRDGSKQALKAWVMRYEPESTGIARPMPGRSADLTLSVRPNPFHSGTWIQLKGTQNTENRTQNIDLRIFDITGKQVAVLSSVYCVLYSGITWNPVNLPPGVYTARLVAGNRSIVKSLYLIR